MFIDRSLSDVAATRIGDFESTESLQEGWKEKNSDTDFFDLFTIEFSDAHRSSIHRQGAIISKLYDDTERFDDREEGMDITDMWHISEGELFEEKSAGDEWECGIFGSRYFDGSRE